MKQAGKHAENITQELLRATELRNAWEEWLEEPGTFPTERLLDAMGDILEANRLELRDPQESLL